MWSSRRLAGGGQRTYTDAHIDRQTDRHTHKLAGRHEGRYSKLSYLQKKITKTDRHKIRKDGRYK
jgi:hypothetical protein